MWLIDRRLDWAVHCLYRTQERKSGRSGLFAYIGQDSRAGVTRDRWEDYALLAADTSDARGAGSIGNSTAPRADGH